MRTLEQVYAGAVLPHVQSVVAHPERNTYGSMAHHLPVLIRTAGLVQALHFVNSRNTKPLQQQLLMDLADVLQYPNSADYLTAARKAELADYMRLTQRTLSALLWFKRYAQSVLGVEAGDEDHDSAALEVPQ